jgi:predicted O-methyltransferase YrrM
MYNTDIFGYIKENTKSTSQIVKYISDNMTGNTFHHHYHILYSLRDLLNKENATYTEIGTYNGGSLCLMLQHPQNTKMISIDPFHLNVTGADIVNKNIEKFNKFNREIILTKQFSNNKEFIAQLKQDNFKTDILFIDGDHGYHACYNDFMNFHDFVNPGGYIVFDDYHDKVYSPAVRDAVDDIVKRIVVDNMPYDIIGYCENYERVHPSSLDHLNEFILRKKE